ncbi:MAG: replication factor C small subunit [Methanobrevibacter boviskoreani]|jgi:replication factor C small subunit|uniref:replication factor C small subunit n=1 Tax=Methanobrevibacter TaxID=2172 RepID=UPI0003348EE8|nr:MULTISPECIES: replication factor C small subunit [Methanobrevibacter]AGN16670.1 replication factor C small subunit RfcS [Methanobrevibacter sp. AbM4]MCI6775623.1 replication factor C small subunit [Methanobrevibacter boviskoreani]MCI6929950.1 replication factor C small subunit [Methanobrevibacter boviskoreani]MDD6256665.1 replication factor C small subunit [Methanobrevibacter boviskoreani]MDY5614303.1 replication factor C small subunit [Methanobrevibacter boviskoreani]
MMGPWVEKYRPQTLDDVVGQDQIVKRLKKYTSEKSMPNLMFSGPAGVGKTTTALALAKAVLGEYWKQNFLELNASDARGIDTVRNNIKNFCRLKPVGAPFRIIFLDEVDNMTKDAQHALRREMEMYTKTASFILSCNYPSRIIDPIQSRCAIFRFAPIKGEAITKRLKYICDEEGFNYTDKGIETIVYFAEGDMRKSVNILQSAATEGEEITEDSVYDVISKSKPEDISNMITAALAGDFMNARDILRDSMILHGTSGEDMITQIYQEVTRRATEGIMDSEVYIGLVEYIADTDFRIREGANPRIQLESLLAKFL